MKIAKKSLFVMMLFAGLCVSCGPDNNDPIDDIVDVVEPVKPVEPENPKIPEIDMTKIGGSTFSAEAESIYLQSTDVYKVSINNLKIDIKDPEISIKSVGLRLPNTEDLATSCQYSDKMDFSLLVNTLPHGENDIEIIAIFHKDKCTDVERKVGVLKVYIFNEKPVYTISYWILGHTEYLDSSNNPVYKDFYSHSSDPEINYTKLARFEALGAENQPVSNITLFYCCELSISFSIDKEKTNFDAELVDEKVYWYDLDSEPTHKYQAPYGTAFEPFNIFLKGTVVGVHEGVEIKQNIIKVYYVI